MKSSTIYKRTVYLKNASFVFKNEQNSVRSIFESMKKIIF